MLLLYHGVFQFLKLNQSRYQYYQGCDYENILILKYTIETLLEGDYNE